MEHNHHADPRALVARVSRIIGHCEAIKKMIEEDRDCPDILIQVAAVKSAMNNVGKAILKDHIDHCVVEAARNEDHKVLEDLSVAIDRYMK